MVSLYELSDPEIVVELKFSDSVIVVTTSGIVITVVNPFPDTVSTVSGIESTISVEVYDTVMTVDSLDTLKTDSE